MKSRGIIIFVTSFAAAVVASIDVTPAQLDSFFGANRTPVLTYLNRTDRCAYFIDFSEPQPQEHRLCSKSPVRSPLLSPDCRSVVFEANGCVYACALEQNAQLAFIDSGFEPHWWIDPDTDSTYVVYCSLNGKYAWPGVPGFTCLLPIDPVTYAALDTPRVILDKAMKGGLSRSGRYLGTAYSSAVIYDRLQAAGTVLNGNKQTCHCSFMPSSDSSLESRMMFLIWPHTSFQIRDLRDTIIWRLDRSAEMTDINTPEFSNDSNFCTYIATDAFGGGTGYGVYAARISDTASLPMLSGDCEFPHLWIPADTAATVPTPQILPGKGYFSDSLVVELRCALSGASVQYTIDGAAPTQTSPTASGQLTIRNSMRIRARAFHDGMLPSRIAGAVFERSALRKPDESQLTEPGLVCSYYELPGLTQWPQFAALKPLVTAFVNNFVLTAPLRTTYYGLVFEGYLIAPRDGAYKFTTASDDGSMLFIGDSLVINNSEKHPLAPASGDIALAAGMHLLRVEYCQADGDDSLLMYWEQPDSLRVLIPDNALARDMAPIRVLSPNGGETYAQGDTLIVLWLADAARITACNVEITFDNGKRWYALNSAAIGPADSAWGEFRWAISGSIDSAVVFPETCKVRVSEYNTNSINDISDKPFVIQRANVGAAVPDVDRERGRPGLVPVAGGWVIMLDGKSVRAKVEVSDMQGRIIAGIRGTLSCVGPSVPIHSKGICISRISANNRRYPPKKIVTIW